MVYASRAKCSMLDEEGASSYTISAHPTGSLPYWTTDWLSLFGAVLAHEGIVFVK